MTIETESNEERELFERMSGVTDVLRGNGNPTATTTYLKLMDELALARVLIRELGDRLAKLEKTEPVKMLEYICVCGKGMKFESKDGIVAPQRTWVGLTHSDIDQGLLRSDYAFKTAEAWRAGVVFAMTKLKEKNT